MLKRIWLGFREIFRDPKDIHRVFAVIPLAALTSHIIYLYLVKQSFKDSMSIGFNLYKSTTPIFCPFFKYFLWTSNAFETMFPVATIHISSPDSSSLNPSLKDSVISYFSD